YLEGIRSGHSTFETTVPTWEQWDAGHLPFARLVMRDEDVVLGWAALSSASRRHVYRGVAESTVYVKENQRGKGIGRALLEALITESEQNGIWTLQASIFPENTASLELHLRCGFRAVGRRERIAQLDGAWRDTLMLERRSSTVGIE
ncbi:MAG TPA: GNAT family N-acetyltransferase, partial [Pyrinomonadaceae bacterium]|nr:GNAT family N-acetyltransferase [Pyrinomonadaceae bacterium]